MSDVDGAVYSSTGLDPAARMARAREGAPAVVGTPGADVLAGDELLTLDVDVLVPAALEGVLHDGNAARTADGTPVVLAVLPDLLATLAGRGFSAIALPGAIAAPAGAPRTPASAERACP